MASFLFFSGFEKSGSFLFAKAMEYAFYSGRLLGLSIPIFFLPFCCFIFLDKGQEKGFPFLSPPHQPSNTSGASLKMDNINP